MYRVLSAFIFALLGVVDAAGQVPVKIAGVGKPVEAMQWGAGTHTVIALHGYGNGPELFGTGLGEELGPKLASAGFRVLALRWAGLPSGGEAEVAAALAWARQTGATDVSLLGHSFGADLAARAAMANPDGTFDTLVLLAMTDGAPITLSKTKKLFVVSDGDTLSKRAQQLAEQSAEPKRSVVLQGTGHAISALSTGQFILSQGVIEMLGRGR